MNLKRIKTRKFLKRLLLVCIVIVVFLFLVYAFAVRPFQVGTGMEPTIKKGSSVFSLLLPLRFINPGRQDIVFFKDPTQPETDKVSRIIGIPGDKIVLKDGYVFLNGKFLNEPYTLSPRSTWVYSKAILGQNCQQIVVPKNNYFLMGDNRTISPFSIYIGFVPKDSIIGYVPDNLVRFLTYYPIDWSSHLRDTTHDKDLMGKSILDVNKYVELINKTRVESGVQPLKLDSKLDQSADLRLQNIIKFDDFSSEATRSGYAMRQAVDEVGYKNSSGFESIASGYYTADSLFNNFLSSTDSKKFLLDKNIQSIGVVSSVTNIDNCPNQVTVEHFLGL